LTSSTSKRRAADQHNQHRALGVNANSFVLALQGKPKSSKCPSRCRVPVEVQGNEWSLRVNASMNFFGIVTLSANVFLDSKGNFDISLQGSMRLGTSGFGLFGDFHFRVRSQVIADNFGNPYFIFELSGGASVRAKLFGITLAGLGLDFSFRAEGNGTVPIILTVKVRIKILFVKVTKTAHFKIGTSNCRSRSISRAARCWKRACLGSER
jgi:hypothetical protein